MILRQYYDALTVCALGQDSKTMKSCSGSIYSNGVTASAANKLFFLYNAMTAVATSNANTGVSFGTGDTPVSVDDYSLSGSRITTLSGTGAVTKTHDSTNRVTTLSSVFTLTNTSDEDITIKEVGLQLNYTGNWTFMVDRTVLEAPLTIQPGGVGQVTYTITLKYPTT